MTRKSRRKFATKKWMVRADCLPRNNTNNQGNAAVTAGDSVRPVRTTSEEVNTTVREPLKDYSYTRELEDGVRTTSRIFIVLRARGGTCLNVAREQTPCHVNEPVEHRDPGG